MQHNLVIVLFAAATALAKDPGVVLTTSGAPTNCGVQGHTCCIPQCNWDWRDDQGCDGNTKSAGDCLETFTVNKENSAYAIAVPKPKICTLSGKCQPCKTQDGCDKGKSLGDIGKKHNCHVLVDAIHKSGYQGSC
ncbi:hypothetical protein NLG97_g5151 [Lecanicillium saksenae]|uniref:Uncharacterized protein n=1 Tax=Lecanicillium saksenae TaxID=468837 RepID=A0ACC1QUF3_9HYPO|nr:hypothetical protein NLG97_g5151 [Lecanicillium saksenae]